MRWLYIALSTALATSAGAGAGDSAELPSVGADISATSVSGLSSGGYMAGQFQVAHSKWVVGAGIVAAGPYGCAESEAAKIFPWFATALIANETQALTGCMANRLSYLNVLDPDRLLGQANDLASQGKIDPIQGLQREKVYLFTGKDDETVSKDVVQTARDFYVKAGVPATNIQFISGQPGGHGFLTQTEGISCSATEPPYINKCGYDQAGEILKFIYGALEPKREPGAENFLSFDQTAFASPDATLADNGTVYIPSDCRSHRGCKIHVVFHGCRQSASDVGDTFIRESGFAGWADSNRIIVLFPQIKSSDLNSRACWDWWGYTGLDFLSKEAPQIKAVSSMVEKLAANAKP